MAAAMMLEPDAGDIMMQSCFNPEAPEFRPSSERTTLRAEAAEFIPMPGGWLMCEALQQRHKRQMPPATDEEWEARTAKREKEVETIKSLQSYRLYVEVFPHDKRGDDDPKTPDPRDRSVSKRMWKWNVEKWRLQLKSRCVYSRAVALQCREYVLQAEAEQDADEIARKSGATGGATDGEDDDVPPKMRVEPWGGLGRLFTVDIPEPPGIAVLPSKDRHKASEKGSGSSATAAASQSMPAPIAVLASATSVGAGKFQ